MCIYYITFCTSIKVVFLHIIYPHKIAKHHKYFQMQIPCPFLLESGDCSIYIVRPQACRKHIIFGNPSTCEYNQKQNTYSGGITKALEDITIQMSSNIFKDKFVLTKHTSTTQEIVFMVKHLTHWFSNGFKDIDFNKLNSI